MGDFPEIPNIEDNPLDRASQEYIMGKYLALFKDTAKASKLSQILALFQDGMLLPFSGLDGDGKPVAKNYMLPVNLGQIIYANQISTISGTPQQGVIKASSWFWQNGVRKCTGG